jgi:hypothetical protein
MKLKELDNKKLIIEREYKPDANYRYSRVVYFDAENNKYYKVWNTDFFYKKHFDAAYIAGFYNDISLLEDVIEHNGEIVGYVMPKANCLNSSMIDHSKYKEFIEKFSNHCIKHNTVYIDFNPENIVEKDGNYYLIDLEAAIHKDNLSDIENIEKSLQFSNYFYVKNINSLLNNNQKIKTVRQGTYYDKPVKYGTANGRIYLEHDYLTKLSGKTLFVGVNYYTDFYHLLTKDPENFETIDVDENRVYDGSPNKHYVGNILDFESQGYLYDNVCLFGVLGHADDWEVIKHKDGIVQCIEKLDSLVKPGGTLMLGPANQCFTFDWWDNEIYNSLNLFKKYSTIEKKKIDINYVWYGRKND